MSVPGSNLLLDALDMIESQPVTYFQNTGRTRTGAGRLIADLAAGVPQALGSVQAVPRTRYQILGLDLEKNYVTWFVPRHVVGLERDVSGDQMQYGTKRYQLETATDWEAQDGWLSILCVQINN